MALTPNYGSSEYLDAATFNAMSAAIYASIQGAGKTAMTPGFILPEGVTISIAGLQATVTFPAAFGLVLANGTIAQAIGNTAGSINTTYVINFASIVPISGSITAYLLAVVSSVGQSPLTIVGPPPGHPDWNPNFVPYTLYSVTQDSITLTASTAAPDNQTTFSLGTVTLTAGMTSLPIFNQNLNYRAGALSSKPVILSSGTKTLGTNTQGIVQNINNASIFTLPPVAGLNGMEFECTSATGGAVTVQSQGADVIWGTGTTSVTSLALSQGSSAKFVAQNGAWYIMASSPNLTAAAPPPPPPPPPGVPPPPPPPTTTVNNFSFDISNPPSTLIDMDINDTLYISFTNVKQVPTFVHTLGGVFRVVICLSGISQANNDLWWKPNNTVYPGNPTVAGPGSFTLWCTENSDGPDITDTNFTIPTNPPYLANTPITFSATTAPDTPSGSSATLGWFAMDAFADGPVSINGEVQRNPNDNINDLGPSMWDVLIGTSTLCKMIKYDGGVAGGCGQGVCRWFDTTTPWTLLGTFGVGPFLGIATPSTISGFCYITKIGGAIS